ncbi:MAG: ribosome silencing factor [Fimbriiglobus sp.]
MSLLATLPFATRPFAMAPLPNALERACLAAKTAADNKGQEILVLDLRTITPIFDFFVIATGSSRRQVHTIVEEVDAAMRKIGDDRMGIEGYDTSKWIVQDYGDVLVHVFDPDTRDYYKMEELWADAKRIDWERDYEPVAVNEQDEFLIEDELEETEDEFNTEDDEIE